MQNQANAISASLSTMLSGFADAVPKIIGFLLILTYRLDRGGARRRSRRQPFTRGEV